MTLLAIVKPHRDQKGKIQFKATSPGLKEASLELKVILAKKNNMIYDR